jgi:hypothetical protein
MQLLSSNKTGRLLRPVVIETLGIRSVLFICGVQGVRSLLGSIILAEFLLKMPHQTHDAKADKADGN